ncbi:MAG: hypothetical protein JNM94_05220 [Phycisphaerae bacterium]|nr:hypothetical protein [Phycisphaerae bacterium]
MRTLLLSVLVGVSSASPVSAAIIYVNAAQALPPESQNGLTWPTAFKSLTDAITLAQAGDQIWVAKGTYVPNNTLDRTATFILGPFTQMYGGFSVGATSLAERDPVANPTILSGDRGIPGDISDNCTHVVRLFSGTNVLLDGLIIEKGNADLGTAGEKIGAGIQLSSCPSFVLRDCVLRGNKSGNNGGAIHGLNSTLIAQGCVFADNSALSSGGAIRTQATVTTFANCTFVGNSSGSGGAVLVFAASSTTFVNCMLSGNHASAGGGAIQISSTPATIANCTFANNVSTGLSGGAILMFGTASANAISNSVFQGNAAPTNPNITPNALTTVSFCSFDAAPSAGTGNFVADASFVDADGADDVAGTVDDDLHLRSTSPCIDRASGALLPADASDLDGDGNVAEPLPVDIDGDARAIDDAVENGGVGAVNFIDIGADEFDRPTRVVFVNRAARGDKSGTSWKNAHTDFQEGSSTRARRPSRSRSKFGSRRERTCRRTAPIARRPSPRTGRSRSSADSPETRLRAANADPLSAPRSSPARSARRRRGTTPSTWWTSAATT